MAGVVAGCSSGGPSTSETGPTATSAPTATRTATATRRPTSGESDVGTGTGHERRVTIDAVPLSLSRIADEVGRPRSAFTAQEASVLEAVLSEGAVTSTAEIDAPFDDAVYVRADGRFYRVERSVRTERELTGQGFRLHTLTCTRGVVVAEDELERARAGAVAFSDLPTVDREAVPAFVRESMADAACFDAGWVHPYSGPDAREASRFLASEVTYVAFDGRYYRIEHLGETTHTEREYRYTATAVADSSEGFETVVDEQVVTHLDAAGLSDAEAETLGTVVEEGRVSWDRPVPPAVDGLVAQFDDGRYVEWEGEYYAVEVRKWVT